MSHGEQVREAAMPVALETARALVRQRENTLGRVDLVAGRSPRVTNPWWVAFWVVLALWATVGAAMVSRSTHQAQRWLDAHPRPTTSEVAGA